VSRDIIHRKSRAAIPLGEECGSALFLFELSAIFFRRLAHQEGILKLFSGRHLRHASFSRCIHLFITDSSQAFLTRLTMRVVQEGSLSPDLPKKIRPFDRLSINRSEKSTSTFVLTSRIYRRGFFVKSPMWGETIVYGVLSSFRHNPSSIS
jgi:hypothetical protein